MAKNKNSNLKDLLKNLSSISHWFENQEEVDLEIGLEKIKEATLLIKKAKTKIKNIENEFQEIKKEL